MIVLNYNRDNFLGRSDNTNLDNHIKHDKEVCKHLNKVDLNCGVLDFPINSLTRERVFNIFRTN